MPKIVGNDGLTFHYWRLGQKTGEDVVMLHGLGGNLAVWHLTLIPTMRKHFHILSFDLRGHGKTDVPANAYVVDDMVEDVKVMMDNFNIEKAHLVGHCLGGDLALHMALLYPERVRSVVSIEPVLPAMAKAYVADDWYGWRYIAEVFEQMIGTPIPADRASDIEFLLRKIVDVPVAYGPSKGRKRNPEPIKRLLEALEVVRDAPEEVRLRTTVGRLTLESLKTIHTPVLLVYEADTLFKPSMEVLSRNLPNGCLVQLPPSNLKHLSALEQPKLIAAYTETFIRGGDVGAIDPADYRQEEEVLINESIGVE